MSDLAPIQKRVPLYEEIADQLRSWVESEGLVPGDCLPTERDLAEILSVSRTSVRQALTVLRTMGLIEVRHGDGIYLRRSTADVKPELARELVAAQRNLPTIMETREALETQLVRLAARRRNSGHLDQMRSALDAMSAAIKSGVPADEADGQFHAAIAAAADNVMLADLLHQLSAPITLTRRVSLSKPGRPPRSLIEHQRILRAIEARDEREASAAMRDHLTVIARITEA